MLTICTDILPQNSLSYLAFRLACLETLTLMEFSRQVPAHTVDPFGYLTEVPFLREVAPQVQIALLADTWTKHRSKRKFRANLVDEAVVFAACETSARIIDQLPELVPAFLEGGPCDIEAAVDQVLSAELRGLHLQLANEGDFLLVSQLQDLPPEEASEFKQQFKLNDHYLQPLFDVLGQWHVPPEVPRRLTGLLEADELGEYLPLLKLAKQRR